MAKLYATSPNGTAKSIQLETMNVEGTPGAGWTKFQNGLIMQWGINQTTADIYHPILMSYKIFCSAIHIGTNATVNIIALDVRAASPDISYFTTDFGGTPNVTIFWMVLGS